MRSSRGLQALAATGLFLFLLCQPPHGGQKTAPAGQRPGEGFGAIHFAAGKQGEYPVIPLSFVSTAERHRRTGQRAPEGTRR